MLSRDKYHDFLVCPTFSNSTHSHWHLQYKCYWNINYQMLLDPNSKLISKTIVIIARIFEFCFNIIHVAEHQVKLLPSVFHLNSSFQDLANYLSLQHYLSSSNSSLSSLSILVLCYDAASSIVSTRLIFPNLISHLPSQ